MSLTTCPECTGKISDKAFICPHCGYPIQDKPISSKPSRKNKRRRPNGAGTVVKLSGSRRKPYQVRVNTRLDERGYPTYNILGTFPDRVQADIALAEYNKDPYDPINRQKLFKEVFAEWYLWKYKKDLNAQDTKTSSQYCSIAAYKHCRSLHDLIMSEIRIAELQEILDRLDLSHATLEHIKNLFNQMYIYAMRFEIVTKNYADLVRIGKEDDTESGVPFTTDEMKLLWKNKEKPFVDTILIYCYSGWRINELARMPLKDIDLINKTFTGGLKNRYSRNRTVPIHSKIYNMVKTRYKMEFKSLIYHDGTKNISETDYRNYFNRALEECGIVTVHTPHDCRHTCNTLLDNAEVNRVARYKIMGHAGKDINEKIYTHKTLKELREAIEKI